MLGHSVSGSGPRVMAPSGALWMGKLRGLLVQVVLGAPARVLGAADGRAVGVIASRELTLILRSREWHRFLGMWGLICAGILLVPLLYRPYMGQWRSPSGAEWCAICGYVLQAAIALAMVRWSVARLRRDLYTNRLDELMLTRCSPADIAMGEGLASSVAALWLASVALPVCLFLSAVAGQGWGTALRMVLSLIPAGVLGVWFGMGWGLAFTLRRSAAMVPLTQWWVMGPFIPVWIGWSALGCFPIVWAVLSLVPGGTAVVGAAAIAARWVVHQVLQHWNPVLVMGAASGLWPSTWLTDWVSFLFVTVFMTRKSMDAIQLSLAALGERGAAHRSTDYWIHHDGHYFAQYSEKNRLQPAYRDAGNPIAAFDVALGHRVYLHPFLWCVALMIYLFLLGWSLLVPHLGLITGTVAVLIPATGALLLMSGGVAVSFGYERDQHRWPALAVLPISNLRLALGKIKGVVRPTLWVGLLASLTALLLGWRGAIQPEVALWMALHVLVFPVALAGVSATLALTTPTLGEALYRWAVLGAIPTLATLLPFPIGGHAGLALPFTPPLLVLLLVLNGPTPDLIRAAWIAFGLEVFGIGAALLILNQFLRRWTVGERD